MIGAIFLCHKACWTANKAITGSRSMFTVDAKPTWTCDIAGLPSEMSYTRQLHLSLHLLLKIVTFAITSVNFFNNKIQMMKPASSVSPQNFQLMTSTLTSLTCQSCSVTSVHLLLVKYWNSLVPCLQSHHLWTKYPTSHQTLPRAFCPAHSMACLFSARAFPSIYKTTSVTPLLKKANLVWNNPANFRLFSKLRTISRISVPYQNHPAHRTFT